MSGFNFLSVLLVVIDSLLVEVRLKACCKVVVTVLRDRQIQNEEGLFRRGNSFRSTNVELCL